MPVLWRAHGIGSCPHQSRLDFLQRHCLHKSSILSNTAPPCRQQPETKTAHHIRTSILSIPESPTATRNQEIPPPTTSRPSLAELVHTRVHGQALARHALRRAYAAGAGPASSSQHRKVSTGKRAPGGDVPDVCLGWTCALATCALGAVRFGRCTRLAGPERARGKPRRCD